MARPTGVERADARTRIPIEDAEKTANATA
jgi:hypothetical protein